MHIIKHKKKAKHVYLAKISNNIRKAYQFT